MTTKLRQRRFLGLLAVAAVLTAASSSSGTTGTGQSAAKKSGTTSEHATPQKGSGGSAAGNTKTGTHAPVDVCSIMPAAEASAASGQTFTSAKETDPAPGEFTCLYDNGRYGWVISVYQSPYRVSEDDYKTNAVGQPGKPVSGIGDEAYYYPESLDVRVGDRVVLVGSANNDLSFEPGYKSLAKAFIAKLK